MSQEYPGRNYRLVDEPSEGDDYFHPVYHEWTAWSEQVGYFLTGIPILAYRRRVHPDSPQDKQLLALQSILDVITHRGTPADKLSTIHQLTQAALHHE